MIVLSIQELLFLRRFREWKVREGVDRKETPIWSQEAVIIEFESPEEWNRWNNGDMLDHRIPEGIEEYLKLRGDDGEV